MRTKKSKKERKKPREKYAEPCVVSRENGTTMTGIFAGGGGVVPEGVREKEGRTYGERQSERRRRREVFRKAILCSTAPHTCDREREGRGMSLAFLAPEKQLIILPTTYTTAPHCTRIIWRGSHTCIQGAQTAGTLDRLSGSSYLDSKFLNTDISIATRRV